ncbi:MAG TPA: hybrid sensor histidine kinase/response regulator [Gemmatimonadaceae bacterium]|jgi:signal transduction histidine kinase
MRKHPPETILVVDDTEANRYAVGRMLRAAGFETQEVSNGRQAIEAAESQPDLIVLDVNLPDMTGFDVAQQLRANPDTAAIPLLHLTASYMREEDRVHGLESGADAYLTHPIEPAVFLATIRSLLRVRRLEQERVMAAAEWSATFDAISDVVCVVDSSGCVTLANRAAMGELSEDGSAIAGKDLTSLMTAAYPGLDGMALREALARHEANADEYEANQRCLRIAFDPLPQRTSYAGSVVCVVTDVTQRKIHDTERTALLHAAERARAEAEEANRAKSEFLATMSHEIRTPINAILGYTQILDMGISGPVSHDQRAQLDRLRRSASHLLTLVNELLDLGKVESGKMRMSVEESQADEVIEDALAIARPHALARAILIEEKDAAPHGLCFVGDTGRVRQILVNLLSNAVKFSEAGSPIKVWAELSEGASSPALPTDRQYVAFRIRDTGIGVSEDQIAAIFEPFVQGESGTTRTRGGSGLGLAISRRLARLMGGDITVASDGPARQGSLFTLWIPAAPDQSSIVTTEARAVHLQTTPFDPTVLAQLGRLVITEAMHVGHALAARLRSEDGIPPMGGLSDGQLVDHVPSYITDLGMALIIVSEVGVEASALLHDGNAIRSEIAERHGAQRRRLGWSAKNIEREYDILLEEIERVLRARAGSTETQLAGALELIARLVDHSKMTSVRGHREAGGTED